MRFEMKSAPARAEQVFVFDNIRLSVITERILRIEKNADGIFCDKSSQMAVCRDFKNVEAKATKQENFVIITFNGGAFRVNLSTLKAEAARNKRWVYPSDKTNLGGTARTLDGTVGILGSWKTKKEKNDHFCLSHMRKGIFASNGVAEIDDSNSFLFNEDGTLDRRKPGSVDKYIFAFGDDYLGGLKEFYSLCGSTPVLPKYALGNWWSRYYAYSQQEYLDLMLKFKEKNIPFTVATIDMDWHIVKNVPKDVKATIIQGAGWTGYTFEESLFPDYKGFFKTLKEMGLAITMNLHPHDGVRYFEKQYNEMCASLGQNPSEKKPVKFNLLDTEFRDAYFDILHHPYEKDGVDFWWIDWQQGTEYKTMPGFDPLPVLNHYHFLDNCRNNKNGLILSRFQGLGSHRYPVGFSGDTVVVWKSLQLQPWFTATASNAGYTWWSHDIGGHVFNSGNNELYLRWLQFGVFSPINRLHSNNTSISKEPWNFPDVENIAESFLRLRHRLLPLIYSANVMTNKEGIPLICPMYYYDKSEYAYSEAYKNQYYFASQLIVAPVTSPRKAGRANVSFYLPEGKWTHIFTGKVYEKGRYEIDCPLDFIPVFAKEGAIIPLLSSLDENKMGFENITFFITPGEGEFTLYDDGGSQRVYTLQGEVLTDEAGNICENCCRFGEMLS